MKVQYDDTFGLLGIFFRPSEKDDAVEIVTAIIEYFQDKGMDTSEIEQVLQLYESRSPTIQ